MKNEISIGKVKEEWGWMGNMGKCKLEYEGKEYKSSEGLFICLRFEDEEIKENLIEDLEYLETMVKSSLQTMTDGIEHENTIEVELTKMLKTILKQEEILGLPIKMTIKKEIKLRGRAIALERLFSNLINNALIYGGGVEVSGKQKENGIFIQIMDRGPGLTDSDKENVFKPYYRLENKLSDSHSGLGMGIARNIANIHGGELELKDRAGGGLIVEVYFPVQ